MLICRDNVLFCFMISDLKKKIFNCARSYDVTCDFVDMSNDLTLELLEICCRLDLFVCLFFLPHRNLWLAWDLSLRFATYLWHICDLPSSLWLVHVSLLCLHFIQIKNDNAVKNCHYFADNFYGVSTHDWQLNLFN